MRPKPWMILDPILINLPLPRRWLYLLAVASGLLQTLAGVDVGEDGGAEESPWNSAEFVEHRHVAVS